MSNEILTPLSLLQISGPDPKKFLQGLVTCDIRQLSPQQANLGALCDPKGRVLADFVVIEYHSSLLLLIPTNMITLLQKIMHKYLQFSKEKLNNISDHWHCYAELTTTSAANFSVTTKEQKISLNHPAGKLTLMQHSKDNLPTNTNAWQFACIQAGLATIEPNTSGLFTPHMLNLQKFNAISFKKGCYIGQEIIARTEHLGKLKRHLYQLKLPTLVTPGTAITTADDTVVGTIINSASDATETFALGVLEDRVVENNALFIDKKAVTFL